MFAGAFEENTSRLRTALAKPHRRFGTFEGDLFGRNGIYRDPSRPRAVRHGPLRDLLVVQPGIGGGGLQYQPIFREDHGTAVGDSQRGENGRCGVVNVAVCSAGELYGGVEQFIYSFCSYLRKREDYRPS